MNYEENLEKIREIIKVYLKETEEDFDKRKIKIPLMIPSYDDKEIMQVIDSLLKKQITLNLKSNTKVSQFEENWANYIDTKEGIMFNSGSSANLIALKILTNPSIKDYIKPGSEIITPALTWTTTVAPIWCAGCKPVFIDVDLDTFTIKTDEIEKAITDKTRAIMPVHLLGYPCDMEKIMEIAKKHNLFVIEDCCEAHGAEINGKKVGSFGDLSTFSFFFSHHLTTMEGGIILTNNEEYAEIARTMRSQGIMRNAKNEEFEKKYLDNEKYKDIDKKYLFINLGYNLRPTEINGGFGLEQFKKFNSFLEAREENGEFFLKNFEKFSDYISLPKIKEGIKHAWFSFPIFVKKNAPFSRKDFEKFLNEKGMETRQIMSGNITKQPAFELFESATSNLKNTELIHKNAFFFGNYPKIKEKEKAYILNCFEEFFSRFK